MNSKLFRPFSACAQRARSRCLLGCLFWPLGTAILLSFALPNLSQGATLSGIVYVDLNVDGAFEEGDWGVRSDIVQLFDAKGNTFTATTNSQGQYSFADLSAGTYTVKNTIPCYAGNTANVGEIFGSTDPLLFGEPNSALVQISNIQLQANDHAINYNFGNDQYPIQLYSKYMLTFDTGSNVQPAVPVPVPEPSTIVQLLPMVGMICGWAYCRRRRS